MFNLKTIYMIKKLNFRLQLFAIVGLIFITCKNKNQVTETGTVDTNTGVKEETANMPAFDTSRSVTTISPDLYTELADTLNIRLLRGVYRPGDSSIVHGHPDFALYVLDGGIVELTGVDGNKQNIEFKKDMAIILPATTHSAKNIGKTTLRLVVVEVNRPRG